MNSKYSPIEWNDEVERRLYSAEEMETNRLEAELVRQLTAARNERSITQKELEKLSGVKQSAIARLERGTASPGIKTLLKLLRPLNMTLAIVPVEEHRGRRVAEA